MKKNNLQRNTLHRQRRVEESAGTKAAMPSGAIARSIAAARGRGASGSACSDVAQAASAAGRRGCASPVCPGLRKPTRHAGAAQGCTAPPTVLGAASLLGCRTESLFHDEAENAHAAHAASLRFPVAACNNGTNSHELRSPGGEMRGARWTGILSKNCVRVHTLAGAGYPVMKQKLLAIVGFGHGELRPMNTRGTCTALGHL